MASESPRVSLSTALCDLLGVRYPVIQAPMAGGWTTPELVSAVSNAGGFGSLAGAGVPPEQLREDIRAVKEQTDRPFAVNFLLVGYAQNRDDPVVGPLVLVGAGGVLAEVYRDYALRIAPVSETEAAEMIEQVKGLAAIRGYRNLPRGDVKALAQAVSALSRLALAKGRPVREAEINPLIVKASGVVAVDALVA